MKNALLVIAISIVGMMACEESIHKALLSKNESLLVVEGVLTNEKIKHVIKLSTTYKNQNEKPTPASGAVVQVHEDNVVYLLTESPAASGEYYTPEMRAVAGKTYILSINYENKEYQAQDFGVAVEPLKPIALTKVNDLYTLEFSTPGKSANYIDHYISWKNTNACITGATCEGKVVFYDLKTTDVNEIFKPAKEDFNFPANTTIIRKKYSVSPEYKSFLRAMLSETEWRGGIFDVQRANVPTNLSEGAVGFFAVSTIVSDTTIVGK